MISKTTFLFLICFCGLKCLSQKLLTEALYSNKERKSYKIERKYGMKDSSFLYLRILNDGKVYIRQSRLQSKDTLILQQEYGAAFSKEPQRNLRAESDSSAFQAYCFKKRMRVSYYKSGNLIGKEHFSNQEFKEYELGNEKPMIEKIMSKEAKGSPDSMKMKEVVKSYYLDNFLIRAEWYGGDGFLYDIKYYSKTDSGVTAKKVHRWKDSVSFYCYDTLKWNADTTRIIHLSERVDWKKKYCTIYEVNKNNVRISWDAELHWDIIYMDKYTLHFLLEERSIFDDPLYTIELLDLDRKKEILVKQKDLVRRMDYAFNKTGQISTKKEYKNEQLFRNVSYKYYR